ncbi:MAG: TFIIB-type zinc ribbon-containing protein [Candidatus Methanomethylicaceae archaeon]|nr:TFIIB-type zinc ribbon-containing protein [Candidatus Verstraetearchaeota archaeon]
MKCPLCNSNKLFQNYEEIICGNCGLVINDQPYEININLKNPLITTLISKTNKDGKGNLLEKTQWIRAVKLRKMHKICKIINYEERVLSKALIEINKIVSLLNIPSFVKDTAINIFSNIRKIKNRLPINATIIASLYAACKIHKIPRTIDEFCSSKKEKHDVWRVYRYMVINGLVKNGISNPEIYVSRICNLLGVKTEVLMKSYEIIKKARDLGIINGKSPYKFAVASVYYAMQELGYNYCKSKVAKITGVSEYTIRKIVKSLKDI